ncbi:hypothetical protein LQW54_009375 [Pestalotiopsis sp. IQ-011]
MMTLINTLNILAILVYLIYRRLLPRPQPGIPYDVESVGRPSGSKPDRSAACAKHGGFDTYRQELSSQLRPATGAELPCTGHRVGLGLVALWRAKVSHAADGAAADVLHDFDTAALDAIWVAILGETLGGLQDCIISAMVRV